MSDAVHCPACPVGPELRVLDPHLMQQPLRRCDGCLGVLLSLSSVAVAPSQYHSSHYVMSVGHGRHSCRSCGELFDIWRERCRTCLKEQTIGCVRCLMPMELVEVAGVALDVCRPCRMVWFDRGELGLLTKRHSAELQSRLMNERRSGVASELMGAALQNPDSVYLGAELARVSANAAVSAASQVSASGVVEVTAAAGEGAAELAGAAIEVLLSVFDGL
jgi:Zn-finger nucleic acid-binding protein